jgi:copper chaperone NosL
VVPGKEQILAAPPTARRRRIVMVRKVTDWLAREDALRNAVACLVLAGLMLIGAGPATVPEDIRKHPACSVCGMSRQQYASSRMLIDYREGPVGTCSIRCTAVDLAANRQKRVLDILVADHIGRRLIPAKSVVWVIGGDRSGVMTKRAKWAFGNRADAEAFIREHGGSLATYDAAMKATFEDLYDDTKTVRERSCRKGPEAVRTPAGPAVDDRKQHRECKYCGMDREAFGYSRMLIRYDDGTEAPTCSIHCAGLDLALNPFRGVHETLVGDYDTRALLQVEKAVWVLGGDRMGVMSIRGKWAFGERKAAERFIKEHGGAIASYDEVMKAVFEDIYEILR